MYHCGTMVVYCCEWSATVYSVVWPMIKSHSTNNNSSASVKRTTSWWHSTSQDTTLLLFSGKYWSYVRVQWFWYRLSANCPSLYNQQHLICNPMLLTETTLFCINCRFRYDILEELTHALPIDWYYPAASRGDYRLLWSNYMLCRVLHLTA